MLILNLERTVLVNTDRAIKIIKTKSPLLTDERRNCIYVIVDNGYECLGAFKTEEEQEQAMIDIYKNAYAGAGAMMMKEKPTEEVKE